MAKQFSDLLSLQTLPWESTQTCKGTWVENQEMKPSRKVVSGKHSICTHFPKDPNCDICLKTKKTRASCRRRAGTVVPRAENLGDLTAADHKVLSDGCESRNGHRYAVVVQDLATQWIQSYPRKTKTLQETERSLQKFVEPTRKHKVIYADNSLEFGKACEDLSWNHCPSTPHRPETNRIAERVELLQHCCNQVWMKNGGRISWNVSAICDTIQDPLSDGRTPYERRFGEPIKEPIIPFGSLIEYHPIFATDLSRLKVLPGVLLGYVLYARRIWKGDIMFADIEELEKMDASETHAKRLDAKKVITPKIGDFHLRLRKK